MVAMQFQLSTLSKQSRPLHIFSSFLQTNDHVQRKLLYKTTTCLDRVLSLRNLVTSFFSARWILSTSQLAGIDTNKFKVQLLDQGCLCLCNIPSGKICQLNLDVGDWRYKSVSQRFCCKSCICYNAVGIVVLSTGSKDSL